jgi:hypothetical protein
LVYTDPKTGLVVRALCTRYKDFPAVEWVLRFENPSRALSPIIEDIQAVETDFRALAHQSLLPLVATHHENAGGEGSETGWWQGVGNWVINRKNFPNGIRPVSDAARKLGMGFVLWFEPERVYQGTRLDREHPDWLISTWYANSLLTSGIPCRRGSRLGFRDGEAGLTVYRQVQLRPQTTALGADADRQASRRSGTRGLMNSGQLRRHPGLLTDN